MTDWTDRRIPPPADWQAFERLCHRLWMKIWQDPNAQMNGRSGQPQHGVDVYGQQRGTSAWSGLQCKGKDERYGRSVTADELKAEIEKAKKFTPALSEYILATTADNDASIQETARRVTEDHRSKGLFSVHVLGWTEIVRRLSDYCPEAVEDLLHLAPGAEALPEIAAQVRAVSDRAGELKSQLQRGVEEILGQLSLLSAQAIANPEAAAAHAQLDQCRDLLREQAPRAALRLLERLRDQESDASVQIRFRIHTNIGAAYLALGQTARAAVEFLTAFSIDSTSDKAAANRVLALLLQDRLSEARSAAQDAIIAYPASALAWAAWINIEGRCDSRSLLTETPAEVVENVEVLFALGNMAALRGDYEAAENLLRRARLKNPKDIVIRGSLAAVLLIRGTDGGHIYLGAIHTSSDLARVTEAAELLDGAWAELRQTELAEANVSIVANRCAIHLAMGEFERARALVDDALAFAPDEAILLRLKVRLALVREDYSTAQSALLRLKSEDPEYSVLRAMVLRPTRPVDALQVLEALIRATSPETTPDGQPVAAPTETNIAARCLFADLLCTADLEHAEARFSSLPLAGTRAIARSTLIFAQALNAVGLKQEGRRHLEEARAQLTDSVDPRSQSMLADTLYDFDEIAGAVELYRPLISPAIDSPGLRKYLSGLLMLDQRQTARVIADQLSPEIRAKHYYQWWLANLALRAGNLAEALQHLEARLKCGPSDLIIRIRWAQVSLRLNRAADVLAWWTGQPPDLQAASLDELLELGGVLAALNRVDDSAAVFYQAHRCFPSEARAHFGLVSIVLFRGESSWQTTTETLLKAGWAFGLRDDTGVEHTYVLEDMPERDLASDELTIRAGLGARVSGGRVGDVIVTHQSELATH